MSHTDEVSRGERFRFGENWSRFLDRLTPERIAEAERSLLDYLSPADLRGRHFMDVGSGSGLFSLAARRLGAQVLSFDYDPQSVACTTELKHRFFPRDDGWTVTQGSVLDRGFLARLGPADVVYSWGVLHHTGEMWRALDNVTKLVRDGGSLYISIYNDQRGASRRWRWVKRTYNRTPPALRFAILGPAFVRLWSPTMVRDLFYGRPFHTWRTYASKRGMSAWHDLVDWVGGYPFETAKPEEVFDFCRERGFEMRRLKTCWGGLGCNQYVFAKPLRPHPRDSRRPDETSP